MAMILRSSEEEWDRYESANWRGLLEWLDAHPAHPERREVLAHLHAIQEEYFTFGRRYLGWMLLALTPGGDGIQSPDA